MRVNLLSSKRRAREGFNSKRLGINIKEIGKGIYLMEEENKFGIKMVKMQNTREIGTMERKMVKVDTKIVISGSTLVRFLATSLRVQKD